MKVSSDDMNTNVLRPAPPPVKTVDVKPIDDGWIQWIAENLLRSCTPESMLQTMTAAGWRANARPPSR